MIPPLALINIVNGINQLAARVAVEFRNRFATLASNLGASIIGTTTGQTVQEILTALAQADAALGQNTGASLIKTTGGQTVQQRLDALAQTPAPTLSPVVDIPDTAYSLLATHSGSYLRFTNTNAKTVTVRLENTHALPANGEWHFRNVGTSNLTFVGETGVVEINIPYGGGSVVPPGGTMTLKRVGVNKFDLMGVSP